MRRTFYFVIIGVLLLCVFVTAAHAATITVTNTLDSGPGSLRQALRDANDGDTINFAVTGTITLTSGGLPINKNITISGPDADQLSIDGNQAIVVFGVFYGKAATISGLTARNAQSGILNDGTIPKAAATRPLGFLPSPATSTAISTRPTVIKRSNSTPAAAAISPWVILLEMVSSRPATSFVSEPLVRT